MKNKALGCLVVLLVFFLLISLAVNVLQLFGSAISAPGIVMPKEKLTEVLEKDGQNSSTDRIVQLDLEGMISNSGGEGMFSSAVLSPDAVKRALNQALADTKVKAIVLRVNTPGGEVTASDTLYHAIKQAAAVKPVVVYMDSMATSGGYYLSCGATKVVANETTLTGSIGVIIQTLNYSQAFGKVGLESLTFVSGAFKDSLNGARPMRDEEKAYVQDLVTDMYDKFVTIVADARKIDVNTLKNGGIADGRVFTGKEALEKHLVDQLGYIEDAHAAAKELAQSPDAMVIKYQSNPSFLSILSGNAEAAQKGQSNTVTLDVSERLLPRLKAGHMYLLPSHMAP